MKHQTYASCGGGRQGKMKHTGVDKPGEELTQHSKYTNSNSRQGEVAQEAKGVTSLLSF